MPRGDSSDNVIIGLALGLGLLALATPIAIRSWLPVRGAAAASPEKLRPRQAETAEPERDLSSQRLAYPGGCGVTDFKDGRRIEAQIRRKLQTQYLGGLEVKVTPACVTLLSGEVPSEAERRRAIKAAAHPWTRIDARGLAVVAEPAR